MQNLIFELRFFYFLTDPYQINKIYAIFPEVDTLGLTHAIILHYHHSSNVCDILNYANVFIFVCFRLCMLFYESCVLLFPCLKCVIILTKTSH